MVGIDRPLRVTGSRSLGGIVSSAVLLPPALPVHIDASGGTIGVLFLDAFQEDFTALKQEMSQFQDGISFCPKQEAALISAFSKIRQGATSIGDVVPALERFRLAPSVKLMMANNDPRVARAVDMIRNSIAENFTTEDVAFGLNLSIPRVVQLFRKNLGIPVGRYRQWHRLHSAALAIASGKTFTQAAADTGFSDLAHFSNTFHAMLGLNPSQFLGEACSVRYFVDPELACHGFQRLQTPPAPFAVRQDLALRLRSLPTWLTER